MCAHDMNVVSTASVLPRTPADVNGFLNIVFAGPGKFKSDQMGPMFRVRKDQIRSFLVWLKYHNRLYSDILLEPGNLMLYPSDDMLPELSDRVVENNKLDVKSLGRGNLDFRSIQRSFW
ncbi:hypothetical protein EDB19DRAFT_1714496 [Suillus lakei]|nr:hypothetical protein EDB19DRAFT_1714496 [Suillus lakei]